MESGLITDAMLTASSSFDEKSVGPQNARYDLRHRNDHIIYKYPQLASSTFFFFSPDHFIGNSGQ
jgi:hypothetical protein